MPDAVLEVLRLFLLSGVFYLLGWWHGRRDGRRAIATTVRPAIPAREDDDLLNYLEAEEAAGSKLAAKLLTAAQADPTGARYDPEVEDPARLFNTVRRDIAAALEDDDRLDRLGHHLGQGIVATLEEQLEVVALFQYDPYRRGVRRMFVEQMGAHKKQLPPDRARAILDDARSDRARDRHWDFYDAY